MRPISQEMDDPIFGRGNAFTSIILVGNRFNGNVPRIPGICGGWAGGRGLIRAQEDAQIGSGWQAQRR